MPATRRGGDFSLGVKLKSVLGRFWGQAGGKDIDVAMSVMHDIGTDEQYVRAHRAIDAVRRLPENWDGAGASQVSKRAADRAQVLVSVLQRESSFIPGPKVSAMPDGGVHLLWSRVTSNGVLEAEVRLDDDGGQVTIGYAHAPGFDIDEYVRDSHEVAQRIRDRFKFERG